MRWSPFLAAAIVVSALAACASQSPQDGGAPVVEPGGGEKAPAISADDAKRADAKVRIAALREKAAAAKEAGRHDEAKTLWAEAEELMRAFPPAMSPEDQKRADAKVRIAALREQAAAAKAAGRHDEAKALWAESEELMQTLQAAKTKQAGGGTPEADLARKAEALREKARAVREAGNADDAAHLEEKAARIEKSVALQREANDLERRAHEAKQAGRPDEAEKLTAECKRVWHESQELLGGAPDGKHKEKKDAHAAASQVERLQMKKAELAKQLAAIGQEIERIDEELRRLTK